MAYFMAFLYLTLVKIDRITELQKINKCVIM